MTDDELEYDEILAFLKYLDNELVHARAHGICLWPIRVHPDIWRALVKSPDPRLIEGADGHEPILCYTSEFGAVTLMRAES